jgi:hypothetical protein
MLRIVFAQDWFRPRICSLDLKLLFQAETHRGTAGAFGTIRRPAAGAECRNQHFAGVAADFSVGPHGSKAGEHRVTLVSLIAFVALFPWRALGTLRTLRAGLALRPRHALNPLRTLRSSRSLNAGFAFRAGIAATGAK